MGNWYRNRILMHKDRGCLVADGPHVHTYYSKAFVLPLDAIRAMLDAIRESMRAHDVESDIEIVAYTGKSRRTVNGREVTVDELSTYYNGREDRIFRITIRAQTKHFGVHVEFDDIDTCWSVAIIVEGGEEQQAQQLSDTLTKYCKDTFQWYSFLTARNLFGVLFVAWFALFLYAWFLRRAYHGESAAPAPDSAAPGPDSDASSWGWGWLWYAAPLVGGLAVGHWIYPLFERCLYAVCPRGQFLIGQEVHRNRASTYWRRWIIGSVLVVGVSLVIRCNFL